MILFPHTSIFSIKQFPLFLLAPQITVLQGWDGKNSQIMDSFTKAGFCQVEYPAPFVDKEEEQRFSHLLTDIFQRKDDYAAQLGRLTLAARTGAQEDGEHSERAIIQTISGKKERENSPENKSNTRWQARLILALAELLDTEQETVDRELALLNQSSHALFEELHGTDNEIKEEKELQQLFHTLTSASQGQPKHTTTRIQAWQTLFTECKEIPLITQNEEAASLYAEKEKKSSLSITLPALIAENAETAYKRLRAFHDQYEQEIAACNSSISAAILEKDTQPFAQIEEILTTEFPSEQYGRNMAYILC